MRDPIHVRTVCYTDPKDESKGALIKIEVWAIPLEDATRIGLLLEAAAKRVMAENGWGGREEDLKAQGPMQ